MALHTSQDAVSATSLDKGITLRAVDMGSTGTPEFVQPQLPTHEEDELAWTRVRSLRQDAFSEFLATMTLILFGDGSVAQVVLSRGEKGDYQSISWGWG